MTNAATQAVLDERGKRYGDFDTHSIISQSIKNCMQKSYTNWDTLPSYMRESLEMIAHKIGRILNGDPFYLDSWVDIGGYNQLVINELQKEESIDHETKSDCSACEGSGSGYHYAMVHSGGAYLQQDLFPTTLGREHGYGNLAGHCIAGDCGC